jgi:hypothetical protein
MDRSLLMHAHQLWSGFNQAVEVVSLRISYDAMQAIRQLDDHSDLKLATLDKNRIKMHDQLDKRIRRQLAETKALSTKSMWLPGDDTDGRVF